MKTIYLKSNINETLIADIQSVLPDYNGEIEYAEKGVYVHYIGDIMIEQPTFDNDFNELTPAVMVGAFHANLLVEDDFDVTIFKTLAEKPNNSKHIFA